MMNKADYSMISPHLIDENFDDESETPMIEGVHEITDQNGTHVVITFEDGTKAHNHTHGTLSEEYYDSCMTCLKLVQKANKWMKNNMWKNKKIDIGMMAQTSLMLATVSKMMHLNATCISADETERIQND